MKQVFEDIEGMFDEGPHGCFRALDGQLIFFLLPLWQSLDGLTPSGDLPVDATGRICELNFLSFWRTKVTGIGMLGCSSWAVWEISETFAAVETTVWTKLLTRSEPVCAFMPKYHWLPFLV